MIPSGEFIFNPICFEKRSKLLINLIEELNLKEISALAFIVGNNEMLTYNKSSALQEWLYGYDLQDTLTIISKYKIVIVSGKKKIEFLKPTKTCAIDVILETRIKDENFGEKFKDILTWINFDVEKDYMGIFEKDRFTGQFAESWYTFLERSNFKKTDLSVQIASILVQKDEEEIKIIARASKACCDIYSQYVKSRIVDIIDDEKSVKHSKLSHDIENELENVKYIGKDIQVEEVESCFPPIIQSGGNYNLKFSSSSDNRAIEFDCIITLLGVRYKFYCSCIVRTLMVKPSNELKEIYTFLLALNDILIDELKPNVKFNEIWNKIMTKVKECYPNYVDNFVKNIGFCTGLEFRENSYIIESKNNSVVKPGMVFCTLIGFQNLMLKSHEKAACVAVGDTVSISETGCVLLTGGSKKTLGSCSILFNDEVNTSSKDDNFAQNKESVLLQSRKRQLNNDVVNNEEQRKIHQAELKARLNEEARRRLIGSDGINEERKMEELRNNIISYKTYDEIPKESDLMNLKIYVDKKASTILLPIYGMNIPFHISTIKSVSSNTEGNYIYLRINFNTISGSVAKTEDLSITYGKNVFVKEMIYRCENTKNVNDNGSLNNLSNIFHKIKELQKTYKSKTQEQVQMEGIIKQDELIINPSKTIYRLKEVLIKPQITTKRSMGCLEAHVNGFRFSSMKGERIDILYNNILHAFFQPCDSDATILIHFRLKNPILIGKKKCLDVQFYNEIGEIVTDIGGVGGGIHNRSAFSNSMMDRDELEAEQAEKETKNRYKSMYKIFIEKVETFKDSLLEFEMPFKDLGFYGVPNKTSVFLMPTTRCLINLTDQPFFIVPLIDIELVHFERVTFHMKNFDMVIIYKDYHKRVSNISSISMTYLEVIKDWLNSCDIKYTESNQNLNWPKIMKTILDDPNEFFSTGGWSFLDPDSDNVSDNNVEPKDNEDDDDYKPDPSDEENYDESLSSDSDYQSENSYDSVKVSQDSESGKSWSELEEEARAMDAIKYGNDYYPSKPVQKKRISSYRGGGGPPNKNRRRF